MDALKTNHMSPTLLCETLTLLLRADRDYDYNKSQTNRSISSSKHLNKQAAVLLYGENCLSGTDVLTKCVCRAEIMKRTAIFCKVEPHHPYICMSAVIGQPNQEAGLRRKIEWLCLSSGG